MLKFYNRFVFFWKKKCKLQWVFGYHNFMAYIFTTILLWAALALLVPLKRSRDYYPVIIFSALLGTLCDLFGVVFHQWVYYGPVVGGLSLWSDLGIAPAEGGLFIRLYPREKKTLVKWAYVTGWAAVNAFFEWFFVKVGWIGYRQWSPLRAFIFYIFFFSLIWAQEYWYNGTGQLCKKGIRGKL
jgi:hypothetical protein